MTSGKNKNDGSTRQKQRPKNRRGSPKPLCKSNEDRTMTDNELLIVETSPNGNIEAFVEQDERVAVFYLRGAERTSPIFFVVHATAFRAGV